MAQITINDKKVQSPTLGVKNYSQSDEPIDEMLKREQQSYLTAATLREETVQAPAEQMDSVDETVAPKKEVVVSDKWLSMSRSAYDAADAYYQTSIRPKLEDSIRLFNNRHAAGSHLAQTTKEWTSKLVHPFVRAIINKWEAMCDLAFFSNPDITSIEAENPTDKGEIVAAQATKALVQYRLTKSVPWYQITISAFQDCQVQALACGHYYWVSEANPEGSRKTFKVDKPVVELIALENVRFDPNCIPYDIANSSPYLIIRKPMYIGDVKKKIASGFFRAISDSDLQMAAGEDEGASVRMQRARSGQDPKAQSPEEIPDYQQVWIYEHMHRVDGVELIWYVLGNNICLAKDPVPLEDVYWHGARPYVIGSSVLDAHDPYPMSTPQLLIDLQTEYNEFANHGLNVNKMILNPKIITRSGQDIDLGTLVRNEPGSGVEAEDPEKDVRYITPQADFSASFANLDKIKNEMDEVTGNFSQSTVMAGKSPSADPMTAKGMELLSSNISVTLEHNLRIFAATWYLPMIQGIIRLMAKYETDETIFAVVGQQIGEVLKKNGFEKISSDMLDRDLVVKINVGMGATDPMMKLRKLQSVVQWGSQLMGNPITSMVWDTKELLKEGFANIGYGDGTRFLNQQMDPQTAALMQQLIAFRKKATDKENSELTKLLIARERNAKDLAIAEINAGNDKDQFLVEKAIEVGLSSAMQPPQLQNPQPQQPQPGQQGQGQPPGAGASPGL